MTAADELLLDSPAARPCLHPRARHEHGTVQAYNQDKCRCGPCRAAHSTYENHRARQIAYGRWNSFSDGDPIRSHVRALMSRGLPWKAVAARAGVSQATVQRLLYGAPGKGNPPSRRVLTRTAEALLAVAVGPSPTDGGLWET